MLWEDFSLLLLLLLPFFMIFSFGGARDLSVHVSKEGKGPSSTASICWVRNKLDTVSRHVSFLSKFLAQNSALQQALFIQQLRSLLHYYVGYLSLSLPVRLSRFPATVTALHTKYFSDSNTSLFFFFFFSFFFFLALLLEVPGMREAGPCSHCLIRLSIPVFISSYTPLWSFLILFFFSLSLLCFYFFLPQDSEDSLSLLALSLSRWFVQAAMPIYISLSAREANNSFHEMKFPSFLFFHFISLSPRRRPERNKPPMGLIYTRQPSSCLRSLSNAQHFRWISLSQATFFFPPPRCQPSSSSFVGHERQREGELSSIDPGGCQDE